MDLRMRIGVNTGEVLVGALRAGGDYTAMGDVVNTASRLQTSADPGDGAGRRQHVSADHRTSIAYESRGELVARGREQPVDVWVGHRGVSGRPATGPAAVGVPLLGRDSEMIGARELGRRCRSATTGPRWCCCWARPAWARPAWPNEIAPDRAAHPTRRR